MIKKPCANFQRLGSQVTIRKVIVKLLRERYSIKRYVRFLRPVIKTIGR